MSYGPAIDANHPLLGVFNRRALAERRRVAHELWHERQRLRLLAQVVNERDPPIMREEDFEQASWWWRSKRR